MKLFEKIFILTSTGQLLLEYPKVRTNNSELYAGFMAALQNFTEAQYNARLSQYIVGDKRFDLLWNRFKSVFLIGQGPKDLSDLLIERKLEILAKISKRFSKEFNFNIKTFNGEVTQFLPFLNCIDEILALELPYLCSFSLTSSSFTNLPAKLRDSLNTTTEIIFYWGKQLVSRLKRKINSPFAIFSANPKETGDLVLHVMLWDLDRKSFSVIEELSILGPWKKESLTPYTDFIDRNPDFIKSGAVLFDWYLKEYKKNSLLGKSLFSPGNALRDKNCLLCGLALNKKSFNQCVICLGPICPQHVSSCTWCGSDICNDNICQKFCQSCGNLFCDNCLHQCDLCKKDSLCGDCLIWDNRLKKNLCLDCWLKIYESDLRELINRSSVDSNQQLDLFKEYDFSLWELFKISKLCYLRKNFARSFQILKMLVAIAPLNDPALILERQGFLDILQLNLAIVLTRLGKFLEAAEILKDLEQNEIISLEPSRLLRVLNITYQFYKYMSLYYSNFEQDKSKKMNLSLISNMLRVYSNKIKKLEETWNNRKDLLKWKALSYKLDKDSQTFANHTLETKKEPPYLFYLPPIKVKYTNRTYFRKKERENLQSPYDSIKTMVEDAKILFNLPFIVKFSLFYKGRPIEENVSLIEYPPLLTHPSFEVLPYKKNFSLESEIFPLFDPL